MAFDANLTLKRIVKQRFLVENRSKLASGQLLGVAGFVAVFIEASYPTGEGSNAVFYRGTCHAVLHQLAVSTSLEGSSAHGHF